MTDSDSLNRDSGEFDTYTSYQDRITKVSKILTFCGMTWYAIYRGMFAVIVDLKQYQSIPFIKSV